MSATLYSEDNLVQQTTAEYLEERLGWHSVYAYTSETFGSDGTLGRTGEEDVVLTRYLCQALGSLNPGLPEEAIDNGGPHHRRGERGPVHRCRPTRRSTISCATA